MATPEIKVIKLKLRRGTNAQRKTVTLDQGELGYTTDSKRLYVGDGATTGGLPVDTKHSVRVTKNTSLSDTDVEVNDVVLVGNPAVAYQLIAADYTDISNWRDFSAPPDNGYIEYTADNNKSGYLTLKAKSIDMSVLDNSLSSNNITIEGGSNFVVRYNSDYLDSDVDGLKIAANGVSETEINATSLGDGLTGGSGELLRVLPDYETLDFNINGELTVINTPLTAVRQEQLSAGLIVDPITGAVITALRGVDTDTMTLVDGVIGVAGLDDTSTDKWNSTYSTVCANSASWAGNSISLEFDDSRTDSQFLSTNNFRLNDATPTAATSIFIKYDTAFPIKIFEKTLAGDEVYIEDQSGNGHLFTIDGLAIDTGSLYTMSVRWKDSTGNGSNLFEDEDDCSFQVLPYSRSGVKIQNVSSTTYTQADSGDKNTHYHYDDTTAGGAITVTLEDPADHLQTSYHKKLGNTGNIILTPPSGTIDGGATYTLTTQYESVGVYSDGTNYFTQ